MVVETAPSTTTTARTKLPAPHDATETLGTDGMMLSGTRLEAAFCDPAYQWPPPEGQGKNAIELQASLQLLASDDEASIFTTESARQRLQYPHPPRRRWLCCPPNDAVYQEQKRQVDTARRQHARAKTRYLKQKERRERRQTKYQSVPEGLLIYRFDTSTGLLELVSESHPLTPTTVVQSCTVARAEAAPHKSRRTLAITDIEGNTHLLTACEQRTATAWLEAMELVRARGGPANVRVCVCACCWSG